MYLIIFTEVFCFIIAIICLIKDANLVWRSMVLFLLLTCAAEVCGKVLKSHHQNNQWIYNIFLVFEAGFTSLMFNEVLSKYIKSRPLILSGLALLFALYAYELIKHGFFTFNDLTATVMSVIFVLYSFYYYYLLLQDQHYVDIKTSASFWWVSGALFFYFGSTIINVFYMAFENVRYAGHDVSYFIYRALTIILYSCWSYAFINRKWLTKTLQN